MDYLNDSPTKSYDGGEKKNYKRWSKQETADGITKRVDVEEVSNGYIITIEKYGTKEGESEYINECTKKISMTNPFAKEEDSDEDDGILSSAKNSLF